MFSGTRWQFFKSFLKSPAHVGGVLPSSHALARSVALTAREFLPGDETPLIEVGPGTGALTEELVRLPHPLYLLERNPDFARILVAKFPEAQVICEDFLTSSIFSTGRRGAVVVSSLPIRSLPHAAVFRARFRDLLRSGAVRAVIQYSYGWKDPLGIEDGQLQTIRKRFVLWNLPPAFVWVYRQLPGSVAVSRKTASAGSLTRLQEPASAKEISVPRIS